MQLIHIQYRTIIQHEMYYQYNYDKIVVDNLEKSIGYLNNLSF